LDSTYTDPYSSTPSATDVAIGNAVTAVYILIIVLVLVCQWKLFSKAGKPGWAAIVPVYSALVLLEIAGRPWWWIFLYFIPLAGLVFSYIVLVDIAKAFGKSTGWGILWMCVLPVIGLPMLAFGPSKYQGPSAGGPSASVPPAAAPTPGTPA
jgi:hypothetical protein